MDFNSWALSAHSAKHFSTVQAGRLNNSDSHLNINDLGGDEDAGACFPCPFCYEDIEISVLCSHLQEEHCFDFKNAVCPVCAANLDKDVIGHFTVQHANSVKRRKSKKSGFCTNSSVRHGKDLRLGSNSMNVRGNVWESAPDPLLSPFIFNVSPSDPKDNQKDECSSCSTTTAFDVEREQSMAHESTCFMAQVMCLQLMLSVYAVLNLVYRAKLEKRILKRGGKEQHSVNS